MRRLRNTRGRVLLCAATAALAAFMGLSRSPGAATQTFAAKVSYANAVVARTSDVVFSPPNASAGVFMDSYGVTWMQQSDAVHDWTGLMGSISVEDGGSQLINFLTANMQINPGIDPQKIICSMHETVFGDSCGQLIVPASRERKTVYIAMDVLVNGHKKPGDVTGNPSSFDIAVVYQ